MGSMLAAQGAWSGMEWYGCTLCSACLHVVQRRCSRLAGWLLGFVEGIQSWVTAALWCWYK